ncbi:alpha/beta fold hydrolase [Amycolatopsis taiwanensis]|uniref:alpha/beta fold hydrolase n=1 Tax=Amycolatopsis taiwanensis TaxID=342230 RepID=UPI0004895210|nr:alpha/beta hydrolase [Amycolatopsis taiwanensis]
MIHIKTDIETGSVTSADGTTIGFRRLGHGPGVVIVHGAMESSTSHLDLACALADTFTVYLPDRRGRGSSGPFGANYGAQREVEDIAALLAKTGARQVFGVSSGALITLRSALTLPTIERAAIFEPPLIVNGSITTDFLSRYDREIAEGRTAAALITGMKGAQLGPRFLNAVPRPLLALMTNALMSSQDKKSDRDTVTMRQLAPTLHYDFHLVREMAESVSGFRDLESDVLLLGGSKSPAYLKTALDALQRTLSRAKRVEFPGLDHSATGNTAERGKPETVAQALRDFFA